MPISKNSKSKHSDKCENAPTHHRYLNETENGFCTLGHFTGLHRSFCWCDLIDIDVEKPVKLSCVVCLLYEK